MIPQWNCSLFQAWQKDVSAQSEEIRKDLTFDPVYDQMPEPTVKRAHLDVTCTHNPTGISRTAVGRRLAYINTVDAVLESRGVFLFPAF